MKEVLYICTECLERYSEPMEQCPKDGGALRRFSLEREDPMIGSILDERWIIEDKIGEGGMGAVYRAQQVSVDQFDASNNALESPLFQEAAIEQKAYS